MKDRAQYLVALDLGNTMTRALAAEWLPGSKETYGLRYLGCGEVASRGWRRGIVTDIEQVAACVKEAVEQAEDTGGIKAESAVVGIGGPHIQGVSTSAGWTLSSRAREIRRDDVRRVMESARLVQVPRSREILHMVPQEFAVDSQNGVRDPIGLHGSRLEVKVHIITGSVATTQNVVTAVNRAGILVETTVSEALATGEAVLSEEEREMGALVAVVGGGSCELAAYLRGGLRMAATLPIGGDHFTQDLAVGLHTPVADAEIIKKTFGSVYHSWSHEGASVEVPGVGDRPSRQMSPRQLLAILEPRAQELLGFLMEELRRWGLDGQLGAGVVLAGGGARLQGLCDLAEQVLGVPARLALPPMIAELPESLEAAEYAPLVSLLLYGERLHRLREAQNPHSHRWKNLLAGKRRESVR
ncbi:MAG: cell division protein FtsA [Acidobacteria bacterium]|nr:cell division protein FtsA [Acidobacteriota bacterium]